MADLTLYFFPTSFYSQKVLLALYEKDAKFKEELVLLHSGGHLKPSYMRMNPAGKIPTLTDGKKIISDSEKIIDYIDANVHTGSTLVPSKTSSVGQEVAKLRELLDGIRVTVLSYGIVHFQDLSISGLKLPPTILNKDAKKMLDDVTEKTKALADKNPDLRDAYLAKVQEQDFMREVMANKEMVCQVMDDLDILFDDIECTLKKIKDEQGISEFWLVGPRFTAADITLAVLLDRLTLLGIEDRYISEKKHPHVFDYYKRLGNRKSVQTVRKMQKSIPQKVMAHKLKQATPYIASIATVALAIGAAYAFISKK